MPFLNNIRCRLGKYYLGKELGRLSHTPAMVSLTQAKKVGIVFNSDSMENTELVKKYFDYLSALGKKVSVLGYIAAKKPDECLDWWPGQTYITRKDLNWYYKPDKNIIDNFVRGAYDLLLDLNVSEEIPLLYVTAFTMAGCRVGKYNQHLLNLYDVMIETDQGKTLKYFLRNVDKYMESIDKGQKLNEPEPQHA